MHRLRCSKQNEPSCNLPRHHPSRRRTNMNPIRLSGVTRRVMLSTLATLPVVVGSFDPMSAPAQTAISGGLLPSWNDGPAKQAIFDFVRSTINRSSPNYVFSEDRIAVFDQDGTLWVA